MRIVHRVISSLLALLLCSGIVAAQEILSMRDSSARAYGFDASKFVHASRYRSPNKSIFEAERLRDNSSISMTGRVGAPSSGHGCFYGAGLSYLKWLTPFIGVRADVDGGYMYQNLHGNRGWEFSTTVSALFNLSSYLGGYDRARFCEISAVSGLGYACRWYRGAEHFVAGRFGVNVNMKIHAGVGLYVEPMIPMYLSHSGLECGLGATMGLSYDLSSKTVPARGAGRYFIFLLGGTQVQNSSMAWETGAAGVYGKHFGVGLGRSFCDCFKLRLSAAWSRDIWVIYYGGIKMPADYVCLRVEGMFDLLAPETMRRFGCSIIAGPEVGYMSKRDLDSVLNKHYVGITGGLSADCRLSERISVFVEPRFSIIPYTASNDVSTSPYFSRNYYDALLNFNIGIEVCL